MDYRDLGYDTPEDLVYHLAMTGQAESHSNEMLLLVEAVKQLRSKLEALEDVVNGHVLGGGDDA